MSDKFDISEIIITEIIDIFTNEVPERTEDNCVSEHHTLVIKRTGKSVYTIDGKDFTADSNNILFLPQGTEYSLFAEKKGPCYIIRFDSPNGGNLPAREFFSNNESDIMNTVKNAQRYRSLGGPAFKSKCLSEVYSVFTQLSVIDSYTNSLAGKYPLIHKSVKYIEANFKAPELSVSMLAQMSEMGETYYRSIFTDVFGCPPNKYIQRLKVDEAKKLLVAAPFSLEETAAATGFSTASYFCKVFKFHTGLTPAAFAKKEKAIG